MARPPQGRTKVQGANAQKRKTPQAKPIIVALLVVLIGVAGYYLLVRDSSKAVSPAIPTAAQQYASIRACKVFIENSGSMDGYMTPANSQLKSDLNALVSAISLVQDPVNKKSLVDTVELNYINSRTISIHEPISEFTANLNAASFQRGGGDRSSTSLQDILNDIQEQTAPGEVSILVSDMILDLKTGQSPESVSTNIEVALRRQLNKRPEWAIAIWRMLSDFDGKYYQEAGSTMLQAKRPYYIFIMGDRDQLYSILADGQLPANMPLYANRSHQMILEPTEKQLSYAVSPNAVFGSITLDRKEKNVIAEASLGKGMQKEPSLSFEVKLLRPHLLQPGSYLIDASNYQVSPRGYQVTKIREGEDGSIYIRLASSSIIKGNLMVSLLQQMPNWVADVHAEDNIDIHQPGAIDQTYGIKYILGGLQRPYESTSKELFSLGLTLK